MYNFTRSFSVRLAIIVLGLLIILPQALAALSDTSNTETDVSNISPVIRETVSDGGSASSAPTNVGSDVTFTAKAADVNSNDYYLAVCKYQYVKAGNDAAPSCCTDSGLLTCTADEKWAISTATPIANTASVTYTALVGDAQSNAWYAFVCDKVATSAACHPAGGAGDTGFALGTITFTGVPADADTVTVKSITYEFDTTDGAHCAHTPDVCIDAHLVEVGAHAAAALVAAEADPNSHMVARSNVVYVYADTAGVAGNCTSCMAESSSAITSDTALAGGSDANASPFKVNHAGTFGTVTVTDDGVTEYGSEDTDIEPGENMTFTLPEAEIADTDNDGTQDNMIMHICNSATTGFNYVSDTCTGTGAATICDSSAVNPNTTPATCTGGSSLISVPTSHGSKDFMVYVEDEHNMAATGDNSQSYSVIDVPPTWESYTLNESPTLVAGSSDTIDFSVALTDNNGDGDVDNVKGVFFHSTTTHDCTANEQNCYIDTVCTLTGINGDEDLGANCVADVWFNAKDGNWDVQTEVADDAFNIEFADRGSIISVSALLAINVFQGSISYGSVAVGNVSAKQETSMENMGNQALDIMLDGDNMCIGSYQATCPSSYIPLAQQKWYHTDTDFNWSATPTNPGPYTLVDSAAGGDDDEEGCLHKDIQVRTNHTSYCEVAYTHPCTAETQAVDCAGIGDAKCKYNATNKSIWWKLKIPDTQALGAYSGVNSFTTTASGTCDEAQTGF